MGVALRAFSLEPEPDRDEVARELCTIAVEPERDQIARLVCTQSRTCDRPSMAGVGRANLIRRLYRGENGPIDDLSDTGAGTPRRTASLTILRKAWIADIITSCAVALLKRETSGFTRTNPDVFSTLALCIEDHLKQFLPRTGPKYRNITSTLT